jgi:hypothetical protein
MWAAATVQQAAAQVASAGGAIALLAEDVRRTEVARQAERATVEKLQTDEAETRESISSSQYAEETQWRQDAERRLRTIRSDLAAANKRVDALEYRRQALDEAINWVRRGWVGVVVRDLQGTAYRLSGGSRASLDGPTRLANGDELSVGGHTTVWLVGTNGTRLAVGPGSAVLFTVAADSVVYRVVSGSFYLNSDGRSPEAVQADSLFFRLLSGAELEIEVTRSGQKVVDYAGSITLTGSTRDSAVVLSAGEQLRLSASGRKKEKAAVQTRTSQWWRER